MNDSRLSELDRLHRRPGVTTGFPSLRLTGLLAVWMGVTGVGRAQAPNDGVERSGSDGAAASVLTLESIYHPDQKADFVSELPATHWVGKDRSVLLIRRDKTWMRVDPETGQESASDVVRAIVDRVSRLEGIDAESARRAVDRSVTGLKSAEDTLLIRIDSSLIAASAGGPASLLTRDASAWKNATIDPTARRVAYTRDGDLFLVDLATNKTRRLTDDGSETLLDGVLDWTYQEEIYGRGNYRGFWFSHDGKRLAMLRIDIGQIEPYFLSASSDDRGNGLVRRYPKAGDPIPHAELIVWDLNRLETSALPSFRSVVRSTPQQQRIVTGVWWEPDVAQLWFAVSDRKQSWRELRKVDAAFLAGERSESQLVLREESPTWVEPPMAPIFLEEGGLLWRSQLPTGRARLYHIAESGRSVTPITPADFDVRRFDALADLSKVWVTGDREGTTVQSHVYEVATDTPARRLRRLTEQDGWHAVTFSPDKRWFVDRHSTSMTPPVIDLRSTGSSLSRRLADSRAKLPEPIIPPEIFRIETDDGIPLPAMLVRPSGSSGTNRCPVVLEVYGGPQAPTVTDRWGGSRMLYRQLLAGHGIATLAVDNRSSAGRGIADTWTIRGRVGEIEFKDLMIAVDWLKQQSWVDSERLAVRGWSFGGFLTLYAMTHSDAFAAGIAGGSVTDWREYDAFYTERYMGLPSENADGYRDTAPVRQAADLSGRVLLIHGESDDNVHPSETLRMAGALQRAGKDFELMIYPGSAHGVTDPRQRWHLAKMTHRFLLRELAGR